MGLSQRNVLVIGATGQQGGSLARLLLQNKHKVYALTRNRNVRSSAIQDLENRGANIVEGNLDDPDSLQQVLKNIESIFLMGTPIEDGIEGEIRRGKLVADIAKENKIQHLVYSSVVNADKNTGIPHFESKYKVEQYIDNLGIPYTIIGPTSFMENLLDPRLRQALQQGQLALPLSPSTILQQISVQNIAEFSAMVIESPERFLGKRIDIASDEVTGQKATEILSSVLDQKIKYSQIPAPNEDLARMFEWFEKVGTGIDISSLQREYPAVNWITFKDWARSKLT